MAHIEPLDADESVQRTSNYPITSSSSSSSSFSSPASAAASRAFVRFAEPGRRRPSAGGYHSSSTENEYFDEQHGVQTIGIVPGGPPLIPLASPHSHSHSSPSLHSQSFSSTLSSSSSSTLSTVSASNSSSSSSVHTSPMKFTDSSSIIADVLEGREGRRQRHDHSSHSSHHPPGGPGELPRYVHNRRYRHRLALYTSTSDHENGGVTTGSESDYYNSFSEDELDLELNEPIVDFHWNSHFTEAGIDFFHHTATQKLQWGKDIEEEEENWKNGKKRIDRKKRKILKKIIHNRRKLKRIALEESRRAYYQQNTFGETIPAEHKSETSITAAGIRGKNDDDEEEKHDIIEEGGTKKKKQKRSESDFYGEEDEGDDDVEEDESKEGKSSTKKRRSHRRVGGKRRGGDLKSLSIEENTFLESSLTSDCAFRSLCSSTELCEWFFLQMDRRVRFLLKKSNQFGFFISSLEQLLSAFKNLDEKNFINLLKLNEYLLQDKKSGNQRINNNLKKKEKNKNLTEFDFSCRPFILLQSTTTVNSSSSATAASNPASASIYSTVPAELNFLFPDSLHRFVAHGVIAFHELQSDSKTLKSGARITVVRRPKRLAKSKSDEGKKIEKHGRLIEIVAPHQCQLTQYLKTAYAKKYQDMQ